MRPLHLPTLALIPVMWAMLWVANTYDVSVTEGIIMFSVLCVLAVLAVMHRFRADG